MVGGVGSRRATNRGDTLRQVGGARCRGGWTPSSAGLRDGRRRAAHPFSVHGQRAVAALLIFSINMTGYLSKSLYPYIKTNTLIYKNEMIERVAHKYNELCNAYFFSLTHNSFHPYIP